MFANLSWKTIIRFKHFIECYDFIAGFNGCTCLFLSDKDNVNLDVLWMTLARVTVTAWVMVSSAQASPPLLLSSSSLFSPFVLMLETEAWDALAVIWRLDIDCTGECKQLILIRRQNKVGFAIRSRKMGNGTRDTIWSDCFKMILLSGTEEGELWALTLCLVGNYF